MGHYDSCYEADAIDEQERHTKLTKRRFKKLIKELSIEDKEFLIRIIQDIDSYKILFRLLVKRD